MKQDPIWKAFAQTGDPLYYLLYRSVEQQTDTGSDKAQADTHTAAVKS